MPAAPKKERTRKKRVLKNVSQGVAHIRSSFNNTIVTITDSHGGAVASASSGNRGCTGSTKSTLFAAQTAAETAASQSLEHGLPRLYV